MEYPDVEYLIGKLPTEESCAHQCHSDNHQACDLEWSRLPGQLPLVEAGDDEVGYAGGNSFAFFGRLLTFGIIPEAQPADGADRRLCGEPDRGRIPIAPRSEERSDGEEGGSRCEFRGSPDH